MIGFAMMAGLIILSSFSYGQCELPIPPGAKNLCSEHLAISNTANSITIANPGVIPSSIAGSYTVTMIYYDEWTGDCGPQIVYPNATMSATASSIIINPGSGVTLPDFGSSPIIYINIVSNGGGDSYFLIWYNYACGLPLGNEISMLIAKQKVSGINKIFVQRK